ncbi:MAG: UDP-N-acetylmuramoyl-tripeptide--D-alanyl-D-alanine ligase [Candidatus Kryptonium sp.]
MGLKVEHITKMGFISALNLEKMGKKKILGVSTDSRKIKKGEIFFALRGERFDGHDFVSSAFKKGAIACVVNFDWFEKNKEKFKGKILIGVEDTLKALGKLANVYRNDFDIPIIAVAGSNGKTTTKEMIALILGQKYKVLKSEGNLNNQIGVPLTLLRLRRRHQIAVIEFGTNHFGEIRYLCEVAEPNYGLITNIGREHIEFLGDVEGVAREEGSLFDFLYEKNGFVFINADDNYLKKMGEKFDNKLTFGFSKDADVRGEIVSVDDLARYRFKVKFNGREQNLKLKVPGEHIVINAISAFAVGLKFGVSPSLIKKALQSYEPFSKRMEIVKVKGITIINDTYNANPDSMIASLKTLTQIKCSGKRVAVLGDMLELGSYTEEAHKEIGKKVADFGIDYLFTYGSATHYTYEIASGLIKHAIHFDDKDLLVYHLFEIVEKGDVILVKGSRGVKMEEVVEKFINKVKGSK